MADNYISKVLYQQNRQIIDRVEVYENKGQSLSAPIEMLRSTLYQRLQNGRSFSTMTKGEDGNWRVQENVVISGQFLKIKNDLSSQDDLGNIPFLLTKRKTFISFYHKDDEDYKNRFEKLTPDLTVNKSVGTGDIDNDNGNDYIKKLIQDGYLSDTTVFIVLLGAKTKCRKHVDWEISGALDLKVGDSYAGLFGILLPTHPDFNKPEYSYNNVPKRLEENIKTGYAKMIKWTSDRKFLQSIIEDAYHGRTSRSGKRVNKSIPQMQRNTCD
ncbi:hypothetical protein METP2_01194 [Methanosarcinales archaeon]|nr:hypothetical protein METP2_01194 [Methanosarcinales archaeon]